jgi:predicted glycosyltransferase
MKITHIPFGEDSAGAICGATNSRRMKRVLIYSHDTFGLGNIRRMLEIARHLVESSPDISVLVITGSPMLHAFRIPPRIDYVKLPCLSRDTDGRYGARFIELTLTETVRLRANIIRSTIANFAPDLILVDKKPFGVENELSGALADLPGHARRPKLVLLLRDIIDSPEATTPVWRKHGYFEAIETCYDQVLVVGSPDIFDLRREYGFPPFAAAAVEFCGYIARQRGRAPRAQVRRSLGVASGEPLLLVTPGGGQDGYDLINACIEGLVALPASQRPRTHIVCGPEMDEAKRAAIAKATLALPNVSVQDFSDDMMSLMAAADVVLSMGGYNTICELLTLHRRAVVVPRVRPVQEQGIRAARMAARGLLSTLHPDELTPGTLWQALRAELAAVARRAPLPRLDSMHGLQRVTAAVFKLIDLETAHRVVDVPTTATPVQLLPVSATNLREASSEIHAL